MYAVMHIGNVSACQPIDRCLPNAQLALQHCSLALWLQLQCKWHLPDLAYVSIGQKLQHMHKSRFHLMDVAQQGQGACKLKVILK